MKYFTSERDDSGLSDYFREEAGQDQYRVPESSLNSYYRLCSPILLFICMDIHIILSVHLKLGQMSSKIDGQDLSKQNHLFVKVSLFQNERLH